MEWIRETGVSDEMPCCAEKHKERTEKEYRDLMNRLKRIEGQVRGIEKML
ncbi:MAG: metal-sensing transcriptional repressor, partial [Lachnospiraceae bacterium]|nr:metal-sensing transcriptional repressor [Lachnospiraceae bacterium]